MFVRIVTDSTFDSSLSKEELEALGISNVPVYVIIGGNKVFKDGVDIERSDFAQMISENPNPKTYKTSQPSPGDFAKCYCGFGEDVREIISIHPPAKLSGIYNSANLGAAMCLAEKPRLKIEVIDSSNVSYGLGMLVVEAAKMAKAGANAQEIKEGVERMKSSIYLYALLDGLSFVKEGRGGSIDGLAAKVGSVIRLKVIINLHNGKLSLSKICRTRGKGEGNLFEIFCEFQRRGIEKIGMVYTSGLMGEADARRLGRRFQEIEPKLEIPYIATGPALTVQVGPDVVAFCVLTKNR